jgi:hypothetical protein
VYCIKSLRVGIERRKIFEDDQDWLVVKSTFDFSFRVNFEEWAKEIFLRAASIRGAWEPKKRRA